MWIETGKPSPEIIAGKKAEEENCGWSKKKGNKQEKRERGGHKKTSTTQLAGRHEIIKREWRESVR